MEKPSGENTKRMMATEGFASAKKGPRPVYANPSAYVAENPLNRSGAKAMFSFSKADRFG
jgi:hypothetical protein